MNPAWGKQRSRLLWSGQGSASLGWPHEEAAGSSSCCGRRQVSNMRIFLMDTLYFLKHKRWFVVLHLTSLWLMTGWQSPKLPCSLPVLHLKHIYTSLCCGLGKGGPLADQSASGIRPRECRADRDEEEGWGWMKLNFILFSFFFFDKQKQISDVPASSANSDIQTACTG